MDAKKQKTRKEFSAGFILFRKTSAGPKFLLLDYGKHWDYPKGHLEKGETAWQAALRELHEETGITAVEKVAGFEYPLHYLFRSPKKGLISKTVTFFLAQTAAADVRLSEEHVAHAWLGYDQAIERLTYQNAREALQAAWNALQH